MRNQKTRGVAIIAAVALIFGFAQQADAQLQANESSSHYLSLQIAASAGFSSDNYTDYAEKLAKTMSHLDPDQQSKVFGFMPSPSGSVQTPVGSSPSGSNSVSASGESRQNSAETVPQPAASSGPELSWWQDVLASIRGYFLTTEH